MLKTYDTVELASISKDSNNDLDYIKHFKSSSLKYTQSGVNKVDSKITTNNYSRYWHFS